MTSLYCKFCNLELKAKYSKKFCNSSCAAKYNNCRRSPRTTESKLKTSVTMKKIINTGKFNPQPPKHESIYCGPHTKITYKQCTHCKKMFWQKRWIVTCSKECRYQRSAFNNVKKQHIKFYNRFEQQTVTLHSNWEVIVAEWLDDNNVEWTRPMKSLVWHDGIKDRRYTLDFFIVKNNLFVDVKNPLKVKQDSLKLSILKKKYNLLVGNIDECKQGILAALP